MKKQVGFIGLGMMGSGFCRRLLDTGHPVTGYDVEAARMDKFTAMGGKQAASIQELVEKCDIICSSLPNPAIVQEAYLGENGVLKFARAGQVIMDFSTVDPDTTRKTNNEALPRGIKVLDCPISGGPREAAEGTLVIIVGGERDTFDEYQDFLKDLGKTVHYAGPSGCGNVVKLVNNVIAMSTVMISAEAMVMGVKAGIDGETLFNILRTSGARSHHLEKRFPWVLKRDFEARFSLDLARKDMALALDMAKAVRFPTPCLANVFELFDMCSSKGLGGKDCVASINFFEELAGVEVNGSQTAGT